MRSTAPEFDVSSLDNSELHVAVGVVQNQTGQVLIALRPEHTHLGGLWEFPGGKLETGEGVQDALRRELHEELAIDAIPHRPLIKVRHRYPDRRVLLDVWRVNCFNGIPIGMQGQTVCWVEPEHLPDYAFPAANHPIVTAVRLPAHYAILDYDGDGTLLMKRLHQLLDAGIRLMQFRAKGLNTHQYNTWAEPVIRLSQARGAKMLLNTDVDNPAIRTANGLHLSASRLMSLSKRPALPDSAWLGASCHNMKELCQAQRIGVDFALLSPVLPTPSHPGQAGMGWEAFAQAVDSVNLPVYALGGLSPSDTETAWHHGGHGVAGIRGFLP